MNTPAPLARTAFQATLWFAIGCAALLHILWMRGTVLEIRPLVALGAMAVVAIAVMAPILRYWFRPRQHLVDIPDRNVQHDSPGSWMIAGIGLAVMAAIPAGLCILIGLRLLVPLLPGDTRQIPAILIELHKDTIRGRPCNLRATFCVAGGELVAACVAPVYGPPIMDERLPEGTPVMLEVSRNGAGSVLIAARLRQTAQHGGCRHP